VITTSGGTVVEPFSLAAVGGLAITEGIKFLYGQVGELLKRRRDRAAAAEAASDARTDEVPVETALPGALGGGVLRGTVAVAFLDENQERLAQLRSALANYADDTLAVETPNRELVATVTELRGLLESALGQRLTFVGEPDREPSGTPVVRGRVHADQTVDATVIGLEADSVSGGVVEGIAEVGIAHGGSITGAKLGSIGPTAPRDGRG